MAQPYWFANKEEEPMELYHITSRDASVKDVHRANFAPYNTEAQKARGATPGPETTQEEKEAAAKL